jgi:hypothetical protein
MVRAKLFAPAGAPLQLKTGETFFPVQPNLLNTCSALIGAPSLTTGLVKLKL